MKPWDFFEQERARIRIRHKAGVVNPHGAFTIFARRDPVVGITGELARQWVYTDPKLDIDRGYARLWGGRTEPPSQELADVGKTKAIGISEFGPKLKPMMTHEYFLKSKN